MCRRLLSAIALLGALLLSDIAWAERRQAKQIEALTSTDYVDMGIELRIVEKDEHGTPLVPGNAQKMRLVGDPIKRGGVVKLYTGDDGKPTARIVGKSHNPIVWFVSQAQADLIVHDGPISWTLVQGSEGSGKTTVLAMWTAFRVLEHIGHNREIGLTAPTHGRMAHVKKKIADHWPPRWYRFSVRDQRYTFLAGPTVQLASAAQKSEEGGSPFQGFSWVAQGGDEYQDHFKYDGDLIARGREASAVGVPYKRLETSTFKDSSAWRNFRAIADKSRVPVNSNAPDGPKRPLWHLTLLLGLESPFIGNDQWQAMKAGLTDREWRRRVLAQDVGPERQVYYSWSRENVRPVPAIGAVDITAKELSPWAVNAHILLGHDPGRRIDVTVFLKAYRIHGIQDPVWFVVDEITTKEENYENHVAAVVDRLRTKWNCNMLDRKGRPDPDSAKALVRADPYTDSGNDEERPDLTAYKVWQRAGVDIRPAAFKPGSNQRSNVPKEARIDVVNTLLLGGGVRRLYVATDAHGQLAAPKLVEAFETEQRDANDRAEREHKGTNKDRSHHPAALGYGIWAVEKPRLERLRGKVA
jgi:hypothetical protein